ncbi:MAG: hypothetical protein C0390_07365 [Syntrophus sp. (in: bacteria)]|nr:hypothetical protein [Syntrophus sp. (in: bacteria)]
MIKSIFPKIRRNHFLVMVLCCAIPLIGIWALSSFGVLGSWGYYALLLICPLGHILMMRGMSHSDPHETKAPDRVRILNISKKMLPSPHTNSENVSRG